MVRILIGHSGGLAKPRPLTVEVTSLDEAVESADHSSTNDPPPVTTDHHESTTDGGHPLTVIHVTPARRRHGKRKPGDANISG